MKEFRGTRYEVDNSSEVIGRTILILEIFAKRAKTRESKLQVEVARYVAPVSRHA